LTGRGSALGLGWFNVSNIARGRLRDDDRRRADGQSSVENMTLLDDLRASQGHAHGRHRQPAAPGSPTGLPVWAERRIVMDAKHVIRGLSNNPERGRRP